MMAMVMVMVVAERVAEAEDVGDEEGGRLSRGPVVDVRVPGPGGGVSHGPDVGQAAGAGAAVDDLKPPARAGAAVDHLKPSAVAVELPGHDQPHPQASQHAQTRGDVCARGTVHGEVDACGQGFTHHHPRHGLAACWPWWSLRVSLFLHTVSWCPASPCPCCLSLALSNCHAAEVYCCKDHNAAVW